MCVKLIRLIKPALDGHVIWQPEWKRSHCCRIVLSACIPFSFALTFATLVEWLSPLQASGPLCALLLFVSTPNTSRFEGQKGIRSEAMFYFIRVAQSTWLKTRLKQAYYYYYYDV